MPSPTVPPPVRPPTVVSGWSRSRAVARGWWCTRRAERDRKRAATRPLFLFFDESGTFDWNSPATPYYHFGCLTTFRPAAIECALAPLRYEVIGMGGDARLHAAEDRQAVRNRVFRALRRVGGFEFDAVSIDKRVLRKDLQEPAAFYSHFARHLLDGVFARHPAQSGNVVLTTDRLPIERQRKVVEKSLKTYMHTQWGPQPYVLRHSSSESFGGLQAADYCTWAVHKLRLHHDERPYSEIAPFVRRAVFIDEHGVVQVETPALHAKWATNFSAS